MKIKIQRIQTILRNPSNFYRIDAHCSWKNVGAILTRHDNIAKFVWKFVVWIKNFMIQSESRYF